MAQVEAGWEAGRCSVQGSADSFVRYGWAIILITDQYVRFEHATDPWKDAQKSSFLSPRCVTVLPGHVSALGFVALPISLWIGNLAFLVTLHRRHANEFGLAAFVGSLIVFATVGGFRPKGGANPLVAAWDALTFWLTYNLQRNANPNVFQCLPWFREPLIRFGIVGAAITALSLSLLHLSGVHAVKGRNQEQPGPLTPLRKYMTPQGYPKVVESVKLNKDAKAIYDRWSDTLANDGDAPLPARKPIRTLGDLLFSAILFFAGGPLLFVFLLMTTQGNYIASQVSRMRDIRERCDR